MDGVQPIIVRLELPTSDWTGYWVPGNDALCQEITLHELHVVRGRYIRCECEQKSPLKISMRNRTMWVQFAFLYVQCRHIGWFCLITRGRALLNVRDIHHFCYLNIMVYLSLINILSKNSVLHIVLFWQKVVKMGTDCRTPNLFCEERFLETHRN